MRSLEVKIVLLGDSGVGKSSMLQRFVNNNFNQKLDPTIGAAFMAKNLIINNINLKFQIWDTAGQEKYHSLANLYYRDSQAAIIVYDISNKQTFNTMKKWVNELLQSCNKKMIIAIAANKSDLISDNSFDQNKLEEFAKSVNAIYKITSAKSNIGIQDLFQEIAEQVVDQIDEIESDNELQQNNENKHKIQQQNKKKYCNC